MKKHARINPQSITSVCRPIFERMLDDLHVSDAPGGSRRSPFEVDAYHVVLLDDDTLDMMLPGAVGSDVDVLYLALMDDETGEPATMIQVKVDDPLRPIVVVMDEYEDVPRHTLDNVIEQLEQAATPAPTEDGLWWADEDYYPIRPMFVGEDAKLKPEPWCTIVDSDGNVVAESRTVMMTVGRLRTMIYETPKRKSSKHPPAASVGSYVYPYRGISAMPWLREFTEQAIEMMAEGELNYETFRDALHANGLTTSNQAGVIAGVCFQIANSISVHGRGGGSQPHERQHLENSLLRWKRGRETNDVELVSGRNEDGSLKHEKREVWVAPDCTVTTVDHKPIWTFDSETLAIGHVATLHDCKVGKEHCATLETIEGGEV